MYSKTSAALSGLEQRRSQRNPIEASAIMHVEGRPGPFLITLIDVSTSGLRFSSPQALSPGTRVTITCRGVNLKGEIRYARSVEDGFNLGVLVDGATGAAVSETGEIDVTRLFQNPVSRR